MIRKQFGGNSADFALNLCVLGVSSDEADDVAARTIVSKEYNSLSLVCEIRIADKKRTENLSKISLRRQSKFTKSERLCSINVVLSYWLERPGKLNFHQSFNAVDRQTFRRDKTSGYMRMLSGATLALSFFLVIFRFLDNIISLHSLRSVHSAHFAH